MAGFNTPKVFFMGQCVYIHDYCMVLMALILTLFVVVLFFIFVNNFFYIQFLQLQGVEFLWTIIPLKVVALLSLPTLMVLFNSSNMLTSPLLTVKIIGHQWYWEYDFVYDKVHYNFDSFVKPSDFMFTRGLDVNSILILPSNVVVRLLVTSADVLHSFFLPSLGIKLDAVPGRLAEVIFSSPMNGLSYGMCAEICGTGHSVMPISVLFMDLSSWKSNFSM